MSCHILDQGFVVYLLMALSTVTFGNIKSQKNCIEHCEGII